jgi:hypothetical protein
LFQEDDKEEEEQVAPSFLFSDESFKAPMTKSGVNSFKQQLLKQRTLNKSANKRWNKIG